MDEEDRAGKLARKGPAALRLCNLAAHSGRNAERGFPAWVEKELTGKEEEPSELIYFKVYRLDSFDRAGDRDGGTMLGSDKSRGWQWLIKS